MSERPNILNRPPRLPMVFPSILGADFLRMGDECRDVLDAGAEALHIDVMDGHFVPNLTMGPDMVKWLRRHLPDAYLDVHLMVERPAEFIEPFAGAGANNLSFHIEVTAGRGDNDERQMIRRIRDAGCEAGIVLNPDTPADAVEGVLEDVDMVLVMSVWPGFAGQKFIPRVLDTVRWLSQRVPDHVRVQIDGGITTQTAAEARQAGADVLVAASAVFSANDRRAAIEAIRGGV